MRHLLQGLQPQWKEAHVSPLWSLVLLRVCPQTSQARNYPVPLWQEYSLDNTRQPACELLGSDGSAYDNDDEPGSLNEPDGGKSNLDVRAASSEKS